MSITVILTPERESQVLHAAKQAGVAPDIYIDKVLQQHLYRQRITVSEAEEELLQQINVGLSEETWQRYYLLAAKLQEETLLPEEQQELLQITDQLEKANVHRIEALIKLAQLRKTTIDALIDKLGIRPPTYV